MFQFFCQFFFLNEKAWFTLVFFIWQCFHTHDHDPYPSLASDFVVTFLRWCRYQNHVQFYHSSFSAFVSWQTKVTAEARLITTSPFILRRKIASNMPTALSLAPDTVFTIWKGILNHSFSFLIYFPFLFSSLLLIRFADVSTQVTSYYLPCTRLCSVKKPPWTTQKPSKNKLLRSNRETE